MCSKGWHSFFNIWKIKIFYLILLHVQNFNGIQLECKFSFFLAMEAFLEPTHVGTQLVRSCKKGGQFPTGWDLLSPPRLHSTALWLIQLPTAGNLLLLLITPLWRHGGIMVSALISGSSGPGSSPQGGEMGYSQLCAYIYVVTWLPARLEVTLLWYRPLALHVVFSRKCQLVSIRTWFTQQKQWGV